MELARRADANAAAMQAYCQRQQELLLAAKPEQAPLQARMVSYTSIVCGCQ
jgi:hypothetical protein